MTVRAIGDLLAGKQRRADARRTFQPVRRNSRHAGEREKQIWRPLGDGTKQGARRFIGGMLQAAQFYDIKNKEAGKRNGPLGHVALEVLRALFQYVDYRTGRLDPAILSICAKIGRSKSAVISAMRRLKEHGFLDWLRRTEPIENAGAGPQVRQITNAYGFDIARLPRSAAAWLRKVLGGAPPPDCEVARHQEARREMDAMLETVPPTEAARVIAGDGQLGDALAGVAAALEKSASRPNGQNPGHGD